ncbi:hypothetical protein E3T39_01860 [Cryobacterium suzukii]|uniref:Uncharacterized protein n=1 Tax=Cryobacterium suzukii TaxID=1259198 RepID=A0A4R9AI77_9MICO|nr:hypothetical protein [Cryobacterium suzukii]TFD62708.1 hypothetical protein E3T39_01860 [Cryobacterium suzukii]
MTLFGALLLSLTPLLAFWPSIGSVDELVTRFGFFGMGVALVAFVGHTLSLPAFHEHKIGLTSSIRGVGLSGGTRR